MKKSIKEILFTQWNFFRVVRLLLSIVILIQAVMALSIPLGILGALFLVQVFLSPLGCAAGSCGIPVQNENKQKEITYQEIKK